MFDQAKPVLNINRSREFAVKYAGLIEPRECFRNATQLCIATSLDQLSLFYCEGWSCAEFLIPLHYAWLYDPQTNEIVDPTWAFHEKLSGLYRATFTVTANNLLNVLRDFGSIKFPLVNYKPYNVHSSQHLIVLKEFVQELQGDQDS